MRGGGRMRGCGRNHPAKRRRVEPPISEHMQNLNLELELLKQKREMIEQHQLMLENQRMYDQQRKYAAENPRYYEQMHNMPGPSRFDSNFPHYDNSAQLDYIPLRAGRKRPAERNWPRGVASKRQPPRGNVEQSFGSRLGPQPPKNRNKSKTKKNMANEELILRPDCEPSPKVRGRLESTLGRILKEIKEDFGAEEQFKGILLDNRFLLALKNAIRERLRSLVMNKLVCESDELYIKYRCKHRNHQDKIFLRNLMKQEIALNPNIIPLSDDVIAAPMNPANFIKNDVGKVLDAELREIMRKLEIVNNPQLNDREKAKRLAMDTVDPTRYGANEGDTEEIKEWKREFRQKIRQKLPKALLRSVPLIVKFLKLDLVYINTWTKMMSNAEDAGAGDVQEVSVGIEEETAFAPRYCARVRGIPKLPPKIRHFLEPFKPIWMKRNKIVRNLVYVAFRDRAGLANLLTKNGADFGNCYLRITAKSLKKETKEATNKTNGRAKKRTRQGIGVKESKKIERKTHNDSLNISSDLDNQITDLLASVRHAEELEADLNTAMIEEVTDDPNKTEIAKCDEANDQTGEHKDGQSDDMEKVSGNADVSTEKTANNDQMNDKSDDVSTNDKLENDKKVGDDKAENTERTEEPAVDNEAN